jgi:hypothetical protein
VELWEKIIFYSWKQYCVNLNSHPFSLFHFQPDDSELNMFLTQAACYPLLTLAWIRFHSLGLFLRLSDHPFLPPAYITKPVPQPTHFDPKDGGSIFLQNISIYLKDYTMSQPRKKLPTLLPYVTVFLHAAPTLGVQCLVKFNFSTGSTPSLCFKMLLWLVTNGGF